MSDSARVVHTSSTFSCTRQSASMYTTFLNWVSPHSCSFVYPAFTQPSTWTLVLGLGMGSTWQAQHRQRSVSGTRLHVLARGNRYVLIAQWHRKTAHDAVHHGKLAAWP